MRTSLALLDRLRLVLDRGDRAATIDIIRQLVEQRAALHEQWHALARLATDLGEITVARSALELYLEANFHSSAARYQAAGLHSQMGSWSEAHHILKQLAEDVPNAVENAYSRGTTALYVGAIPEAREQLERAVALRPDLGSAWHLLATMTDLSKDEELSSRIISLESRMEAAAPHDRATYFYALGKAHADQGNHSSAFAAFQSGSRLVRDRAAYRQDYDRRIAEDAVKGFDAERIRTIGARQNEPTGRSIFVTGLPRSGTTLVEQILTSHSQVVDGGEIGLLRHISMQIGGLSFDLLERHVAEHGAAAAAGLWNHLLDERFPAPGRVVDKTVNASRFLGLAAALLPEAPLVWVTRDPLDRAWSCYHTYFVDRMAWSYSLEDIAFHFRLEDELLARWQDILGERLLVLSYEDLVTDPGTWIHALLGHCGLEDEPAVYLPHLNRRTVFTSSVMQVRRPISKDAIGSSGPYREYLEPFVAAYAN